MAKSSIMDFNINRFNDKSPKKGRELETDMNQTSTIWWWTLDDEGRGIYCLTLFVLGVLYICLIKSFKME